MTDFVQLAQHIRVEGASLAEALLQWDHLCLNKQPTQQAVAELRWRIPQLKCLLEDIEQSWEWQKDVMANG